MKEDDYAWGAHSGIQKAIRRGDLNLAKTCFDALWSEKEHRNWLKWRLPILVEEEAVWLCGELAEFLATKTDSERDWRKFIYQLTIATKNKDAGAVFALAEHMPTLRSKEMETARFWVPILGDGDPKNITDDLSEDLIAARKMSKYERSALRVMKFRANAGGMLGDRRCCLAAMIMIAERGLDKKRVNQMIQADIQRLGHQRKPATVNLPWYIFDMHTAVGKFAMSVFMKRAAAKFEIEDKAVLHDLWFLKESGLVARKLLAAPSEKNELTIFEQGLWGLHKERQLGAMDQKIVEQWPKIREELEKIVMWCLEVRDKN